MEVLERDNLEQWLGEMRPRVHRFCGRIMGSAIDGEDVTQEALARAAAAFEQSAPIVRPDAWLFRIAHNAAIDMLRQRQPYVPLIDDDNRADPTSGSDVRVEVRLGFAAFLPLPPPQRASVVLIDVLGYSLAETAAILETSVAAVKATLHRGRNRLAANDAPPAPRIDPRERLQLEAYADLFNARAFDALRDLLAADVRLDLPRRRRLEGKEQVGTYFTHYRDAPYRWHLRPVLADGRLALLATDPTGAESRFLIVLAWSGGRIATIQDFYFARYVMDEIHIAEM
ncbi:MAG TPA: sigma-70 family RNA polymerase sigma factor [Sphingomonas sp.]|nr:sigma-70 family RNA polymerase sigma factor [Sphingomonas sp.]